MLVAADGAGVGAEVDLRVERGLSAMRCALAEKVVELSKIADPRRLDDPSPPVAAAFDIGARLGTQM